MPSSCRSSRDAKYEGKTAIDTFFWRFGDLIQAGVVFAGLNWLALVRHRSSRC